MAAWEQSIVRKMWVQVTVNVPCFSGDLYAALAEARQQYRNYKGRLPDSDDAFEVLTGDDKIIIRFEITATQALQAVQETHGIRTDLERVTELLAAVTGECVPESGNNARCTVHTAFDDHGCCYHALARNFLTNKEENPYG